MTMLACMTLCCDGSILFANALNPPFNPFPNDKFQTLPKEEDNLTIGENGRKVLQTGRKHCGKRRNCSL